MNKNIVATVMESDKSDWIYLNNKSNTVRYILGEKSKNMVACIGINPSTAKPNQLDNTLKSVKRIAKFNGFNGWLMCNVYPQRATNPNDLDRQINKKLRLNNIRILCKIIADLKIDTIWLAYGDLIETRNYLPSCMWTLYLSLSHLKLHWKIIDTPTKKGHPRHPLYKATESKLIDFDMEKYIKEKLKPKAKQFNHSDYSSCRFIED